MENGGWQTFYVFKSLNNNIVVDSSSVDVYISQRNIFRTEVVWVLNLVMLESVPMKIKNFKCRTIFGVSSKTLFFVGLGALSGTILFMF